MTTYQKIMRRFFGKPSPVMLARAELEDAQRSLLQAQTAREYAASMEAYHAARIKRLTSYLKDAHDEPRHAR